MDRPGAAEAPASWPPLSTALPKVLPNGAAACERLVGISRITLAIVAHWRIMQPTTAQHDQTVEAEIKAADARTESPGS